MDKKSAPETLDIHEAAKFLGYKATGHLREKAKLGEIPGAFKSSNKWMFLLDELVGLARNYSKNLRDASENTANRSNEWLSQNQKTARTITHGSQFVESECKSRRERLRALKRRNMKSSDDGK